jgi:hypothetical protein
VTDTGREVVANVACRTADFFKKFPADLIFLRDVLLAPFEVNRVTFHIANVTAHPGVFPNLYPLFDDPIEVLRGLREREPRFWRVTIRESEAMLLGRRRTYAAGQRIANRITDRLDPAVLKELRAYLQSSKA